MSRKPLIRDNMLHNVSAYYLVQIFRFPHMSVEVIT
jgi:hypothetical protein